MIRSHHDAIRGGAIVSRDQKLNFHNAETNLPESGTISVFDDRRVFAVTLR